MSEVEPTNRRPALVWVTQVLLVLLLGIVTFGVIGTLLKNASAASTDLPVLGLLIVLLLYLALAGPVVVLFYGLNRRRRWAWRGSIGFAMGFLFLTLVSQVVRPEGPIPLIEIAPSERFGAMLAAVSIPLLLCVYVLRLYLSPKVRAFLGVPQRAQRGR